MRRHIALVVAVSVVLVITGCARQRGLEPGRESALSGATLRLEELTQADLDALDRDKTVFFLTFGNIEEHGPHLPVGADYYRAVNIRDRLVNRLVAAHPDYRFVLMPVIPLGEGGANDAAGQPDHIGTYAIRFETLRSVAMDLGSSIARKGFRNIFIIEGHGAPLHNVAFSQASKFVSERYGVRMVNVTGLSKSRMADGGVAGDDILDAHLGKDWRQRSGFEGHAGAEETSEVLATDGARFVEPVYKSLPPYPVNGLEGFLRTYEKDGWRGYWGDPASSTEALGEALLTRRTAVEFQIAESALSGEDVSRLTAYPDNIPAMAGADVFVKNSLERYARHQADITEWLTRNPWPPRRY